MILTVTTSSSTTHHISYSKSFQPRNSLEKISFFDRNYVRHLFAGSDLMTAPKGVLLHGPPGCGKTMLAKATAREAGARFINLDIASLTDKWYGESQKLAGAVFTLAKKIQPCIIFIGKTNTVTSLSSHGVISRRN